MEIDRWPATVEPSGSCGQVEILLGYCNRVEAVLSRGFYGISAAERLRSSTCIPSAVPLLTILIGVGLSRLAPINLGFALPKPERFWLGGLIVAGAFFGLGLWSVVFLRRPFL
jgi:hypothetical protein